MHIPDGYLSPATCATLSGVMVPIWYKAAAFLKKSLDIASVPYMAIGAVFSFLIMMFNIPIPDGTTAHATGAVLIAIALGPWAAVMAVSVALFIQALIFGDGGILAFGANAFNIAFIIPFAGYYVYKAIGGTAAPRSMRRLIAAGVGGYVGINIAALAAAIEFGIQPILFTAADGTPLYCPYSLNVAVPAMMLAHLTVAGFIEGVVTALALKFVVAQSPELLATNNALKGKEA